MPIAIGNLFTSLLAGAINVRALTNGRSIKCLVRAWQLDAWFVEGTKGIINPGRPGARTRGSLVRILSVAARTVRLRRACNRVRPSSSRQVKGEVPPAVWMNERNAYIPRKLIGKVELGS